VTARLTATNTGTVPGIDTVELYVSAVGSRVERSLSDLRGFAQVSLDPGASAEVEP